MILLLQAIGIIIAGAFGSLLFSRTKLAARLIGPSSIVVGALLGIVPAVNSLFSGVRFEMNVPWQIPIGSMSFGLDPLSAFFAIPILVLSALSAIYGIGYLKKYETSRNIGIQWFFFNLLIASMLIVVLSRNAVCFLLAWEIMALSSFFLVIFESEKEGVRHAGWIYLISTHIGTAFLLIFFLILQSSSGSFDFDKFDLSNVSQLTAAVAFLFAVIGFGAKAGFMPMHIWLPEAHPAAPSHVSAVMSGVMIKLGIYGLLRMLIYLGEPPAWWGWVLIFIGGVSGILGVLFALAQHDLKRLLAYCSVENIGIISIGLGIGIIGIAYENPVMTFMGFAGALLHVINHATFKGLLFLGAGSIIHATGTREIDQLGGLLKKMPLTAFAFIVGSVAICGLPPLNGFISEFLIYFGALSGLAGAASITTASIVAGLVVVAVLALIGGLAITCFTKAFGIIFLGTGRSEHTEHVHEIGMTMWIPTMILAMLCIIIGFSGPFLISPLLSVVQNILPLNLVVSIPVATVGVASGALWGIMAGAIILIVLVAMVALVRSGLIAGRKAQDAETWGCGYTASTPRMQYTSSSFVEPVSKLFRALLGTKQNLASPQGLFPKSSSFSSRTPDIYHEKVYHPVFMAIESCLAKFRWIQHGRLNLYILCLVITLVVLLVWKLR